MVAGTRGAEYPGRPGYGAGRPCRQWFQWFIVAAQTRPSVFRGWTRLPGDCHRDDRITAGRDRHPFAESFRLVARIAEPRQSLQRQQYQSVTAYALPRIARIAENRKESQTQKRPDSLQSLSCFQLVRMAYPPRIARIAGIARSIPQNRRNAQTAIK